MPPLLQFVEILLRFVEFFEICLVFHIFLILLPSGMELRAFQLGGSVPPPSCSLLRFVGDSLGFQEICVVFIFLLSYSLVWSSEPFNWVVECRPLLQFVEILWRFVEILWRFV